MEVILVKSVRKLGKVGEVVNVKNGYGRNYLIPNDIAIRATKQNLSELADKKKELEKRNTDIKAKAEKTAKLVDGKQLVFIAQAAVDGRLFGSISKKDIVRKLSEITDFELNYSNILLDNAIKNMGTYEVEVSLHPEVSINILVIVARAETEVKDMISEYEGSKKEKSTKKGKDNKEEEAAKPKQQKSA